MRFFSPAGGGSAFIVGIDRFFLFFSLSVILPISVHIALFYFRQRLSSTESEWVVLLLAVIFCWVLLANIRAVVKLTANAIGFAITLPAVVLGLAFWKKPKTTARTLRHYFFPLYGDGGSVVKAIILWPIHLFAVFCLLLIWSAESPFEFVSAMLLWVLVTSLITFVPNIVHWYRGDDDEVSMIWFVLFFPGGFLLLGALGQRKLHEFAPWYYNDERVFYSVTGLGALLVFGVLLRTFWAFHAAAKRNVYRSPSAVIRMFGFFYSSVYNFLVLLFGTAVCCSALSGLFYFGGDSMSANGFNKEVLGDGSFINHFLDLSAHDTGASERTLQALASGEQPVEVQQLNCPARKEDVEGRPLPLEIGKDIPCQCVDGCSGSGGTFSTGDTREITIRANGVITPPKITPENPGGIASRQRIVSAERPYRDAVALNLARNWDHGGCFGTGKETAPLDPEKLNGRDLLAFFAELSEDKWFMCHMGVYPPRIWKALLVNLSSDRVEGGSTISMQVAKNLYTTSERALGRKVLDIINAGILEWQFTKGQIMEIYLNTAYLGHGVYGVAGAAEYYFDTHILKITPAQAAVIVSLLSSPERWTPYGSFDKGWPESVDAEFCPKYAPRCEEMRKRVYGGILYQSVIRQRFLERPFYPQTHRLPERVIYDLMGDFVARRVARPEDLQKWYQAFLKKLGLVERPRVELKPGWYLSRCKGEKCYAVHNDGYHYRWEYDRTAGKMVRKQLNKVSRPKMMASDYYQNGGERTVYVSSFLTNLAKIALRKSGIMNLFLPVDIEALTTVNGKIQKALEDAVFSTLKRYRENPVFANVRLSVVVLASDGRILGASSISPPGKNGEMEVNDPAVNLERPLGSVAKIHVYAAGIKFLIPELGDNWLEYQIDRSPLLDKRGQELLPFGDTSPISLREAIAKSDNRAAVAFLYRMIREHRDFCSVIGADLRNLGFAEEQVAIKAQECRDNPRSFALGAFNWPFLAEAASFAVIANGGTTVEPWVVERVIGIRERADEESSSSNGKSGVKILKDLSPQVTRKRDKEQHYASVRVLLAQPVQNADGTLSWVPAYLQNNTKLYSDIDFTKVYVGGKTGTAGSLKTTGGPTDALTFLIIGNVVIAIRAGADDFVGIPGNMSTAIPKDFLKEFLANCSVDLRKIKPKWGPAK